MLPAAVVELERFPLTPNNKVDRAALPLPQELAHVAERPPSPAAILPGSDLELRLATTWKQVLGVPELGVTDDFFMLGGHSLLALEVVRRFRIEYGRELPLALLFANPTIRQLAAALDDGVAAGPSSAILLNGGGGAAPLFCICGVHLYQDLAHAMPNGHPVYGIFIPAPAGVPDVPRLAREYVHAIRRQQPQGPYHLAGFCFGGLLAYEVALQLREAGERVATLALIESYLRRGWSFRPWRIAVKSVRLLFRSGPAAIWRRLRLQWGKPPAQNTERRPAREARPTQLAFVADDPDYQASYFARATRNYERSIRSFDGRVLHFRAADEGRSDIYAIQPGGGFAELAGGGIATYVLPGSHRGILGRRGAESITRIVARQIEEAER